MANVRFLDDKAWDSEQRREERMDTDAGSL